MATNGRKRSIPEASADTRCLSQRIGKLTMGELVSYKELTELIGRDVRGTAYPSLASARRMAQRDFGVVTAPVHGEGIKRLDNAEIVTTRSADIQKIHRIARKGVNKLSLTEINALKPEEVIKFNVAASHLGVLANITTSKSVQRLEVAVQQTQQTLPLAKTLAAFMS